jgi:leucyl aminopeptidase
LPLPPEYKKQLDSEVADLRNIGANRFGGALTAGIFLQAFVGDVPWVHLDIAGPARAAGDDGELSRGGTGFGVRTHAELARTVEPPKRPTRDGARKRAKKTAKKATKKARARG